jgi:hypothetical protein
MRTKVNLIRGQDSMTVEADLVELAQKHVNDYASKWKKQLRLYGQEDKFWDWEFKLQFVISKQPNRERHKSPLSPESLRTRWLLCKSRGQAAPTRTRVQCVREALSVRFALTGTLRVRGPALCAYA